MTSIPSNLARVPNMLTSQVMLGSLLNTNRSMLNAQVQLSSGLRIHRASDDPIGGSAVSVLDDIIERREQRLRNLSHADAVMNNVDAALSDATDILIEVKGIASSQVGLGSDAETRANQAQVVDAMLREMINIANRKYQQIHLFSGVSSATQPIQESLGALRYAGATDGLETDLGFATSAPINLTGDVAFGALSARVEGDRDLDPALTADTRLSDVNGARQLGISLGSINVSVNGGPATSIDLSGVHTVQDAIDTLQAGVTGLTVTINAAGNGFEVTPAVGDTVVFADVTGQATAADLGIDATFQQGVNTAAGDIDPRITDLTPLGALSGVTVPLGMIRLENAGQVRDLDLSSAQTIQDLRNLVEGLNIGVRVEINERGDRLNFINELSGAMMSIGEVGGGTTASQLGVRSLTGSTRLTDFNDGRGVQIRSGSLDPVTGAPDPAADLDFRVTLKDGRTFDVDLAGAETVQDVLDAISTAAGAAGVGVPAEFDAALAGTGNGIELTDNTGPGTTSVTALNGSFAAADLGLLTSTTGATLTGEDRAMVAVDSVFTHLVSLRDALLADDETGITLAGERLEADITRLAEARATVGVRSQRVTAASNREEDLRIQDMGLRSEIRDLDYTEAAIRFSTLQQQLQAGLTTASQVSRLSLLDFLR